jgi:hypothetical protein
MYGWESDADAVLDIDAKVGRKNEDVLNVGDVGGGSEDEKSLKALGVFDCWSNCSVIV